MTTIVVTEDNKMYSDSQVTAGEFIMNQETNKIENIGGILVGCAGRWASCLNFRQWFADKIDAEYLSQEMPHLQVVLPEEVVEEDFSALVLYPDGTLYLFEGGRIAYEIPKPWGIGSGAEYAICAIDAGADGQKAVEVAIKRDPFSGGAVEMVEFGEEEQSLTKEKALGMEKEDIIALLFGEDVPEEGDPVESLDELSVIGQELQPEDFKLKENECVKFVVREGCKFLEEGKVFVLYNNGILSDSVGVMDLQESSFVKLLEKEDVCIEYICDMLVAITGEDIYYESKATGEQLATTLDRKLEDILKEL